MSTKSNLNEPLDMRSAGSPNTVRSPHENTFGMVFSTKGLKSMANNPFSDKCQIMVHVIDSWVRVRRERNTAHTSKNIRSCVPYGVGVGWGWVGLNNGLECISLGVYLAWSVSRLECISLGVYVAWSVSRVECISHSCRLDTIPVQANLTSGQYILHSLEPVVVPHFQ